MDKVLGTDIRHIYLALNSIASLTLPQMLIANSCNSTQAGVSFGYVHLVRESQN